MSSLGYRQLLPYLRGESSLEQAIERIRLDTHRYVRHQETWLRRNPRLIWFDVTSPGWITAAKTRVRAFLNGSIAAVGCVALPCLASLRDLGNLRNLRHRGPLR